MPKTMASLEDMLRDYDFTDIEYVDAGGTGLVFRATPRQPIDGHETVAIKLLRPEAWNDEANIERFVDGEIATQSLVKSPYVVKVLRHVVRRDVRIAFAVMEWVDGIALDYALDNWVPATKLPEVEKRLQWFRKVIEAVVAAHSAGVIIRDLKPANIVLEELPGGELHPRVLDFGHARARTAPKRLTRTGTAGIRSGPYTDPDVSAGLARGNEASDVYSLGVILLELLTANKEVGLREEREAYVTRLVALAKSVGVSAECQSPAFAELIESAVRRNGVSTMADATAFLNAFDRAKSSFAVEQATSKKDDTVPADDVSRAESNPADQDWIQPKGILDPDPGRAPKLKNQHKTRMMRIVVLILTLAIAVANVIPHLLDWLGDNDPYALSILPPTSPIAKGAMQRLDVSVRNRAGVLLAGVPITFSSSKPTVASISAEGVVAALTTGRTMLIARAGLGVADSVMQEVYTPQPRVPPPVDTSRQDSFSTPQPANEQFTDVTLELPTFFARADVFVDGRLARIVNQDNYTTVIRVKVSQTPQTISLTVGSRSCRIQRIIEHPTTLQPCAQN